MNVTKDKMQTAGGAVLLLCVLICAGCAHIPLTPPSPAGLRAVLQPALDAQTSASLARQTTLRLAVELAAGRNPGVQAQRLAWLAAAHRIPQAYTPENPQARELTYNFTGGRWDSGKFDQMLPWPQKLWARGKEAETEAEIARLRYEAALRDLIVEVKNTVYEIYYLDHAIPITEQIEKMLRNDALLAYRELSTGRTQLSEGLRAESQVAQLAYDRQLLGEQRSAQAERLRALLNLPPGTPVGPVLVAPVYPLASAVEPLFARAERTAEVLRIRGLETQRAAYESLQARLSRLPDIGPGLQIVNQGGGAAYMGMATLTLPIYEWRNRALIREKQALEEAARQQALQETNQLRQAVANAWFAARLTGRLVDLYAQTLLPQAEGVMRQADTLFRGNQASFSNLIETTLAWHNFQLAWHRAIADHGQAEGRLEQVLGTTAEDRPDESVLPAPQPPGPQVEAQPEPNEGRK